MKRFVTSLLCLFLGFSLFAQEKIDFFQFGQDFDWTLSDSDVCAKYKGRSYIQEDSVIVKNVTIDKYVCDVVLPSNPGMPQRIGYFMRIQKGSFQALKEILVKRFGDPYMDVETPSLCASWAVEPGMIILTATSYGCHLSRVNNRAFDSFIQPSPREHLQFKGVPIDGDPEVFVKELKKKGFYNYENYKGMRLLQGPFAGYKEVQLFIADYENVVFNVAAYIDMTDSWDSTKLSYENLKSSLRRKYNVEPVVEEFFPSRVREGSGYEYRAFDEGNARYSSTFYLDNGFITLSIVHYSSSSYYQLFISYYDLQNFQRRRSMADDDL